MRRRIEGLGLGADLEVVVDGRRLAIEREAQARIRRHPLQQLVDQVDQAHPEDLERLVPLAVPVRVRDEMDDGLAAILRRIRRRSRQAAPSVTRPPPRRSRCRSNARPRRWLAGW